MTYQEQHKPLSEMTQQEFNEYLRKEEELDNTVRKILVLDGDWARNISNKNALKQFKKIIQSEYFLCNNVDSRYSEYCLCFDDFGGKSYRTFKAVISHYEINVLAKIDISELNQKIRNITKSELAKNPYFVLSDNFSSIFDMAYNETIEINKEEL